MKTGHSAQCGCGCCALERGTARRGYRDLYWCHRLNEPMIIEYRDGRTYCDCCGQADVVESDDDHTFIQHITKPRSGE